MTARHPLQEAGRCPVGDPVGPREEGHGAQKQGSGHHGQPEVTGVWELAQTVQQVAHETWGHVGAAQSGLEPR